MLERVVQATVSSLGYLENGTYVAEPDCSAGVHDLVRFLHNDKETIDARRICLERNIVKNDLVPIMISPNVSESLFNVTLRLTVNLCQPASVVFKGKVPEDEDLFQVYCELDKLLIDTLKAFTQVKLFKKFSSFIDKHFSQDWIDRNESEKTICDRMVMLLRYVFAIGMEGSMCTGTDKSDAIIKDCVIKAFLSTNLSQLLMRVACDRMEKELCVHIMSIFSLLLRSVDCDMVVLSDAIKENEALKNDDEQLKKSLLREKELQAAKRYKARDRSFLGGQYVMKNCALEPNKDVMVHSTNPRSALEKLRKRKHQRRTMKRARVCDVLESVFELNKHSSPDVLRLLKTCCTELIETSLDRILRITRETAFCNTKTSFFMHSDINYFFLCEYVLQFIRLTKLPIEKVSSIFSSEFFNHIVSQTDSYFEKMRTDKLNAQFYVVRAQHAFSVYKEMMQLLYKLSKSSTDEDKKAYVYLTKTIYSIEEYREFGYATLNALQPYNMTRKLLHDLIIGVHFYIITMERLMIAGELQKVKKRKLLIKRRKQAQKKAKKILEKVDENSKTDNMTKEELDKLWVQLNEDVNNVLGGKVEANNELSPLNILLKVSDDQHQAFAVLQINRALRRCQVTDAVGLLRAAREVWSNLTFGNTECTAEEEREILREIFYEPMADLARDYDKAMHEAYGKKIEDFNDDDPEYDSNLVSVSDDEGSKLRQMEDQNAGDIEDDQKPAYEVIEIDLDFNEYIFNYAKPDVIKWYCFVLKNYASNKQELNKAVLKMFHRFAFQVHSPSRLYLASLFRTFLSIHQNLNKCSKSSLKSHEHFEIYEFGYHLLRKFLTHFKERGAMLICELLFTKTRNECLDIEHGYGYTIEQQNKTTQLWSEELEEELKSLYHQYQDMDTKPDGVSIIDFIKHNLSVDRYPKQITRQLKRMALPVEKPKKLRAGIRHRRQKITNRNNSQEFLVNNISETESILSGKEAEDEVKSHLSDISLEHNSTNLSPKFINENWDDDFNNWEQSNTDDVDEPILNDLHTNLSLQNSKSVHRNNINESLSLNNVPTQLNIDENLQFEEGEDSLHSIVSISNDDFKSTDLNSSTSAFRKRIIDSDDEDPLIVSQPKKKRAIVELDED